VDVIAKQGAVPGIKVDTGVVKLAGTLDEGTTQGLLLTVIINFQFIAY
jgi:fructose-bisphosphate aldolase class 1